MPLKLNRIVARGGIALGLGKLSVLVGPNNVGKSQTLRDIRDFVATGATDRLAIVERIEADLPSEVGATAELSISPSPNPGQTRYQGVASDLQRRHEFTAHHSWLSQQFAQKESAAACEQLLRHMGEFWCASLDAESRFRLAASAESYDTRADVPSNALQALFSRGKSSIDDLRSAFKGTFTTDIALDWAAMRRLYLKVGPDFGEIPDTRAELDVLLRDAKDLAQQGDGYKSFAGVLLAVLAFPDRLLLLDEPEAFLHPAQARALGRWLAEHAKKRTAQIIMASHSADFLLGVVSADSDATIIRLNRNVAGTTFHVIPPSTTTGLIQSPLLSSQPVLDALFHRGVVVCEGDPDRAIYQSVLHRYLRDEGGDEVLLIHSNGKDSVKTPIEMLRCSGTPVCAIVDIDVLNSEKVLNEIVLALTGLAPVARVVELRRSIAIKVEAATEEDILKSLQASVQHWLASTHSDLRQARKALVGSARVKSKWEVVKAKGIDHFQGGDRADVDELLKLLKSIGLFIVPCGELEGWMKLGIAKGSRWSRAALEELHGGKCPGDLRDFMLEVAKFLKVR